MDIGKLFGLPAHPLLVHIPIVLLPLVGAGAVAMVVSARVRDRIGWIVVGLAGIAVVGVQLAMGSGEALQESVPKSPALREHIQLADTVRPLAVLLLAVTVAVMLLHRRDRRETAGDERPAAAVPGWVRAALAAATIAVAAVTTVQLIRVGHNGARATWQHVKLESGRDEAAGGG